MHKGENVISFALAVVVVLTFVAIQRQWNPASLKDMASTAEDFILTSTGIRGQLPDLVGYERLKTYRLENFSAALYRRTPASLIFAPAASLFTTGKINRSSSWRPWKDQKTPGRLSTTSADGTGCLSPAAGAARSTPGASPAAACLTL